MKLYLGRHGQTDDNVSPVRFQGQRDTSLNSLGRKQAIQLADVCVGLGIESIFTSQLKRASDTAATIAEKLQLQVTVDDRLAEGWRGRWEGRLFDEVRKSEPDEFAAWMSLANEFRFPEGESLIDHRDRSLSAIKDIVAQGKRSLVVAHGGTIRFILLAANGRAISQFHKVEVPNAELITLEGDQLDRVLQSSRLHV